MTVLWLVLVSSMKVGRVLTQTSAGARDSSDDGGLVEGMGELCYDNQWVWSCNTFDCVKQPSGCCGAIGALVVSVVVARKCKTV